MAEIEFASLALLPMFALRCQAMRSEHTHNFSDWKLLNSINLLLCSTLTVFLI